MSKFLKKIFNKKKSEITPGKSFCMAPFTHTYVSPQGERRLCCASREVATFQKQYLDSDGPKANQEFQGISLDEHWNSPGIKEVRRKMLNGEQVPECAVCDESILTLSVYRNWFNELFKAKIPAVIESTDEDGHINVPAISFDYRVSNLCNFKCRMCGDQLSSSWEIENDQQGIGVNDNWRLPKNKELLKDFQAKVTEKELWTAAKEGRIEELYWVGGEPLVWDIHWSIMDEMVRNGSSKKCFARYNTNLSKIEKNSSSLFEDILPNFKSALMCCSIDAVGDIGEYIRTGLVWDKWIENFKKGCEYNKDIMKLDLTLTMPGLFSMKEYFDLSKELGVEILTKITYAFEPTQLMSPMCLPRPVLNDVLDELLAYMGPLADKNQESLLQTLNDMKVRKTFEEEWPNEYSKAFHEGKEKLLRLEKIRSKESLSMEGILSSHAGALEWWKNGFK